MRKPTLLALALLVVTFSACSRSPVEPPVQGNLRVFVFWQSQGLPDRKLEILELGLVKKTDARGIAVFGVLPGRYTLRAFVNLGGPAGFLDKEVLVPVGESVEVDILDCLPCL